jgi:hypothetical protein
MSTVSVPVSELAGLALGSAVAKCEGRPLQKGPGRTWQYWTTNGELGIYDPSANWSLAGPIIEREGIATACVDGEKGSEIWRGWLSDPWHLLGNVHSYIGPTPLIAAMRCYVASKLGDTVEIPKELL